MVTPIVTPRKYAEIEHVLWKDIRGGRVKKLAIFTYGRPNGKNILIHLHVHDAGKVQRSTRFMYSIAITAYTVTKLLGFTHA